jgi:DNA-binding CsgD family transcriptional regulator/PAS domain-containing protein
MQIDETCAAHNAAGRDAGYAAPRPCVEADRSRQLLELFGLIFDAALDPTAWPEALNRLADATGAHIGTLGSHNVWARALADVAPRHDPDYRQNDRGMPAPAQFIQRDEYAQTDIFREWVAPQRIEAAIATDTLSDDGVSTVLRLNRPWCIGDFDQDESDLFTALVPHIRRAVQLRHRLAALEAQRASAAAAFDRLRDGVIIVDDNFGITFANRSAGEILAEGDGLIRGDVGIAAATPCGTATLRRLVAAAGNSNGLSGPGGRCSLERRNGRSPLSVLVVPLDAEVAWVAPPRPAAVLFVTDPDRDSRACSEALRQRFGLTRAQAAFLAEIVKGDGIQAAADRVGVSLATARTHLRHVFEKTGTQRQAELVGLVALGLTALREGV